MVVPVNVWRTKGRRSRTERRTLEPRQHMGMSVDVRQPPVAGDRARHGVLVDDGLDAGVVHMAVTEMDVERVGRARLTRTVQPPAIKRQLTSPIPRR